MGLAVPWMSLLEIRFDHLKLHSFKSFHIFTETIGVSTQCLRLGIAYFLNLVPILLSKARQPSLHKNKAIITNV